MGERERESTRDEEGGEEQVGKCSARMREGRPVDTTSCHSILPPRPPSSPPPPAHPLLLPSHLRAADCAVCPRPCAKSKLKSTALTPAAKGCS